MSKSPAWKAAGPLRAALVAFGLASLVGMPGQDLLITILFWTLVSWVLRSTDAMPEVPVQLGRGTWVVIVILTVGQVVGTAMTAHSGLRVPNRAARVGWPYQYGLYDSEVDPTGRERRWTAKRAVAVVDVSGPWLEMTVAFEHDDVARQPTDAVVRVDGRTVISQRLTSPAPLVRAVRVPGNRSRIVIESEVGRTVRPRDEGLPDDRDLGLRLSWRFLDQPPPDASESVASDRR